MKAILVIGMIFLLLIVTASKSAAPREDSAFPPDPPQRAYPLKTRETDHFINKHLHRNDNKHDRHKRNQYPW